MARPRLHSFKKDLLNKPGAGSNAPPRTIKAADLDDNFKRVTILNGAFYRVRPTPDGLILVENRKQTDEDTDAPSDGRDGTDGTDGDDGDDGGSDIFTSIPRGNNRGDLLYYNGQAWTVLPSVASSTLHVLTIQNEELAWTPTEACE
jgi:hypothetical protein